MKAEDSLFASADMPLGEPLDCSELMLDQSWLAEAEADELFTKLLSLGAWQQEEIVMYGRRIAVPRLTAFFGEPGLNYRYSGLDHRAEGWPELLREVRARLSSQFDQPFNYVLLNRYRDGRDYMGWHSDDEAAVRGGVASISLGSARRFTIRRKASASAAQKAAKPGPISSLSLASGSLLYMPPGFQQHYLHALPKASDGAYGLGERLNLTFRWLSEDR